ncbi:MAG: PAS domain-containing protein [Pararhodobacter sp.]|nr:PAS domain-containing protein [Pararhodobacter sp.]
MNQVERLLSTLAERERLLREAHAAKHHAATLMQAMDLIYGCEDLEHGLADVLELCRQAIASDQWLLVRRSDAVVRVLASGSNALTGLDWASQDDFLGRPRRVTALCKTPRLQGLPVPLREYRSWLSVPIDLQFEAPIAIVLLSGQPAFFSRFDHELLRRIGQLLVQAMENRRLAHRNAVLAGALDSAPIPVPAAPRFLDTSFEALSKAYAHVAEWQGQVVDITNELLGAPPSQAATSIERALARTGQLARSDRAYVFRVRGADRMDNTHEWVAQGVSPMIDHLQDMPADMIDAWRDDFLAGKAAHIPDVMHLPEDSDVRAVLQMQGIQSMLAVPMRRDKQITGFMGLDAVYQCRRFLPVEIELLRAVANAVNVVLERAEAETEAKAALDRLEVQRSRLHATLSAIPDLVLELDQDGRFSGQVGGQGLQLAMPPEQFVGRLPEEVLSSEHAALARRVMRAVDKDGYAGGFEYQLEIDGVPHWFLLSAAARKVSGRPEGYVFAIRDITERQAERRQLQRLGKIAELTSNLVVITDAQQRIDWVNPAFQRRTGWQLDEVRGKRPDSFLATDQTDRKEMARIGAALRAGEAVRGELLNQSRTGESYWISKDIQPLFAEDGQIEGYVAVQTDITDLKRSHQKALQGLADALEASNDGIAITDTSGRYVYMNAAHRRMFGIGDDENISALSWHQLVPPETVQRFLAEEWQSLEAEKSWRGELEGLRRDGSRVQQEVSLTLRDGGLLCITRDIADRLTMQQALRERAEALDASNDGIAITDATGHYLYMNTAHRRMFGIGESAEISTIHWHELYATDAVQRFMEQEWCKLVSNGSWRGELQGRHRNGEPVQQEVSLTLRENGILCITRDISERLRLEADRVRLREDLQLAQRRETVAQLSSGIAHDLNNLIAVVCGSAALLEGFCADNPDAAGGVARIIRATETARELVKGLGHLGAPPVARDQQDLRHLVKAGIDLLGTRRLREHDIRVVVPDHPVMVWANATEVLQVIVNLVLNACEASGDHPNIVSVTVHDADALPARRPDAGAVRDDCQYAMFTVSDTGTGIEEGSRGLLFDHYFTTKGVAGTGLGLSIVAGLLRNNDAAIWIDSCVGRGTDITVRWPSSPREDVSPVIRGLTVSEVSDLSDCTVLVVDDQVDVADVLAEMLEKAGATVIAVDDAQEAADLLRRNQGVWSVLVTDLNMPGSSGIDLARLARACQPAVPAVLVTALPDLIGDNAALFHAVLNKPVQAQQLVSAVATAASAPVQMGSVGAG